MRLPSASSLYILSGKLDTVSANKRIQANTALTVIAVSNVTGLAVAPATVLAYCRPRLGSAGASPNHEVMLVQTLIF